MQVGNLNPVIINHHHLPKTSFESRQERGEASKQGVPRCMHLIYTSVI